jgi:hypothetical protein
MNSHPYRILMGAGFAMLVGVAGAQTYGNQPSSTGVDKNAPQNMQVQPSTSPTPASGGDTSYSTTNKNAPQPTQAQPSSPTDKTSADQASRSPAVKGATGTTPTQAKSAPQPTDKMSAQANAQAKASSQQSRKTAATNSTKPAHHAAKSRVQPDQTAMQDDKAYRDALRQCAKQPDQNARDSCLDNAIEQFHRNT